MGTLSLALYGEGNTDKDFLPAIIQRTAQRVLNLRAQKFVEVLPIDKIENITKQPDGLDILEASKKAYGMHALIIHKDKDSRSHEETIQYCINPGKERVIATSDKVCKTVIPLIPIREVEAWMIADPEILREILHIKKPVRDLDLPRKARQVESDPDPKQTFYRIVKIAEGERRRRVDHTDIYEALSQEIRLERLDDIPAYQRFLAELTDTLQALNFIH